MKGLIPFPVGEFLQLPAQGRRLVHPGKIVGFQQCLNVQAGSSHQDGHFSPGIAVPDQPVRLLLEIHHGKFAVRFQDIHQMVGHQGQFFRRGFGGGNVHVFEHQHGISGNDLSPQFLGQGDAAVAFAGGSGADDGNDSGFIFHPGPLPPGG